MPAGSSSPPLPQQQAFANPNNIAFAQQVQMAQMNPIMQMQMANFSNPHAMQSLMRNPSPGPAQGQKYSATASVSGFSS